MKKITSMILALLLCFTGVLLVACNGTEDETEGAGAGTAAAGTETETETAAGTETEQPVLKMVTNAYFAPYEYFEGDKIVGIDAEIAAAIAEKLGMELVIESIDFDSIITTVNAGGADFGMAGMTVTDERLLEVDFTHSYATGCQKIVVTVGSDITSIDDLTETTKVGVQRGTTGALYADWDGYTAVEYATANEAIIALKAGDVDCVMIDEAPAENFVKANEGELIAIETAYVIENYAACVKKGNTELLSKLNDAITALTMDGTIEAIIEKYIPAE